MIDILSEDLIDLREACNERVFRNGRTGKAAHFSSIYRHALRGARAANGDRVQLETVRCPGGLRTSREAIQRFIEALTNPDKTSIGSRGSARHQHSLQRAERELAASGL